MKLLLFGVLLAAAAGAGRAADPDHRAEGLSLSLTVRAPDQLLAFYSARGFPAPALDHITRACFVTVSVRNERDSVVWLELAHWRFYDARGRELRRIARPDWNTLWEKIRLPAANRSTFGWTLLPETRDLQPREPVGGNVTLAAPAAPFTLEARFYTDRDKRGQLLTVRVPGLSCPRPDAGQASP